MQDDCLYKSPLADENKQSQVSCSIEKMCLMFSDFSQMNLKTELQQLLTSTLISLLPVCVQVGINMEHFFGSELLSEEFSTWGKKNAAM